LEESRPQLHGAIYRATAGMRGVGFRIEG